MSSRSRLSRRDFIYYATASTSAAIGALATTKGSTARASTSGSTHSSSTPPQEERYTFELADGVERTHVRYRNRYGVEIAGDLYVPQSARGKLPALAVSGPFGAVKEQSSGRYANELARRGFIALAFDPSFTGQSGGDVRDVGSLEIFTEDFSATVDFLGTQGLVDRERIGAQGICGLSAMAITAASGDSRIKAVATCSMYEMARSMSRGHEDYYTDEQRRKIVDYLSQLRWKDVDSGTTARGWHELGFDDQGNIITSDRVLPETLPADADPIIRAFFDYYRTPRGYHPRSINSTTAWTATTPMPFFEFDFMRHIDMVSPRSIMLVAGEQAHSRYYSEDVHKQAPQGTELVLVPHADHVDLYDQMDKIPFSRIEAFFKEHL